MPALPASMHVLLRDTLICQTHAYQTVVELRLPPLISHKETAPSRQSRQKNPSAPIY